MFHLIEQQIAEAVDGLLRAEFGVASTVVVEQPRQAQFGEVALPVAFQLARTLKKAPREIAETLAAKLDGKIPAVASIGVAGNGFLNLRLRRGAYAQALLAGAALEPAVAPSGGKVIVEHTNINPNKAAHIGHLRNAVLGDTFVRMLRAVGEPVEVQNYIDNTGVQVADVVVGFHYLERNSLAEVRAMVDDPAFPFDHRCWDLYARVSANYQTQPETLPWRAETLHAIEAGEGEIAELGHLVADAIVRCHLATMYRLGIRYDVLPRESEILHLKFWAKAFELLKERKAIYLEDKGKNAGCWVMPASAFKESAAVQEAAAATGDAATGDAATDDAATGDVATGDVAAEAVEDSKVIVRSNGTVTYVGKDIAYQLWKFGLLGQDFFYKVTHQYPDGHRLYVSTAESAEAAPVEEARFGGGVRVYNVIDSRQSYLQDVVVAGLRALHYEEAARNSVHFAYEMVALSPRCCADLGIALSEEDSRKAYVEVSGRKGLGVKADDLMDKLTQAAYSEVLSRNAERGEEACKVVARQVAVGALRYFLLKFTRNSVIAFDFQEALSFEGETGPYVQYAAVRANRIFDKWSETGEAIPTFSEVLTGEVLEALLADEKLWQLLVQASKRVFAVARAVNAGEPANLAKHAFQAAQSFNEFYHEYPILKEKDPARRAGLLWLATYFRQELILTLEVLGIEAPEFM
ncbi:MAG: arginine--tRNA ligase [Bryobacterales bacterium]|nr:arginine--tRNA ligase [Bryobacterales bacterium]